MAASLLTPGERNYWKTHDFAEMSVAMIDTVVGYVDTLPDPQCEIFFAQLGGAQGRVPDVLPPCMTTNR